MQLWGCENAKYKFHHITLHLSDNLVILFTAAENCSYKTSNPTYLVTSRIIAGLLVVKR